VRGTERRQFFDRHQRRQQIPPVCLRRRRPPRRRVRQLRRPARRTRAAGRDARRCTQTRLALGGTEAGHVAVYYVHPDHLDTPRTIVSATNVLVWSWDGDPFGTTPANENPNGLGAFGYGLRFPGQQYDAITGLHYNYFRDYEAGSGRYVQSDPIGLDGGINTYAYVEFDPTSASDPFGLKRTGRRGVPAWTSPAPAPGMGIYAIIDCHGEILYVGQTNSFRRRWSEHRNRDDGKIRMFNRPCCPARMAPLQTFPVWNPTAFAKLERNFISKINPISNKRGRSKCCS
jgi:RHS repeat-associated protein